MGNFMAANLKKAGFSVSGFDLSEKSLEVARKNGISTPKSAIEAIKNSDYIITMLPNTLIVSDLMEKGGVFENAKKDAIIIDSSTIEPFGAQELHKKAKSKGLTFVDAPVSGGVVGAENASLVFMVGAENQEVFTVSK